MQRQEIVERVKKVVAQVLKINDQISDNSNFIFDLGADSMQSLLLVAAFQEEFGIDMEEDQALQVQTVSDAVDFIAAIINR
ncbi:MAG: acyl carrier protein [Calditrichaeota bacterium]|nr:MAG: acyl carrier protein [Calditrichota bacterium]